MCAAILNLIQIKNPVPEIASHAETGTSKTCHFLGQPNITRNEADMAAIRRRCADVKCAAR
jgi:hypothetical protein